MNIGSQLETLHLKVNLDLKLFYIFARTLSFSNMQTEWQFIVDVVPKDL